MTRLPQLDMLRFLAVFLVFGRHIVFLPPENHGFLHGLISVWHRGGWVGVDVFFVLSGFLISGLLFREYEKTGRVNVLRFLIRRGFKIYPGFWMLILVTVAVYQLRNQALPTRELLGELLFLQNYIGALWWHTWSLAVEEHFYFAFSGLVALLVFRAPATGAKPFAILPRAFIGVAVVCLLLRAASEMLIPEFHLQLHFMATHIRIDSLMFGVAISYFWHFENLKDSETLRRHRGALFACGLLFLSPAFLFEVETTPWVRIAGFVFIYAGAGMMLVGALFYDVRRTALVNVIATLGSYSYSIYLWHLAMVFWGVQILLNLLGQNVTWYVYFGSYIAGSLLLGVVAAKLIEMPALALRDRLFPSLLRNRGQPGFD